MAGPFRSYIGLTAQQMAANVAVMPPEDALRQAEAALAVPPVPGYPGFTLNEIRALAAYRCQFAHGVADPIWGAIVNGDPEAWMYAVHEAAEIEAFAVAGIDFLDPVGWQGYFQDAHIIACIQEAHFLKAWAEYLGYNTIEMALEIHNPIRKQYYAHARETLVVQQRSGWVSPGAEEEDEAQAFYRRILS